MKINITGISKEKVIITLFENVFQKSESANKSQTSLFDRAFMFESIGFDSVPKEKDITKELAKRRDGAVDYIGCVKFQIRFSDDSEIDVSAYDTEHQTSTTPGVLTAAACIEALREKERKRIAEAEADALAAVEAAARAKAQRQFVVETVQAATGATKMVCYELSHSTNLTSGLGESRIEMTVAGSASELYEKLTGPEREIHLTGIKAQYDQLHEANLKAAANQRVVTEAFTEVLGTADLMFIASFGNTSVRIGAGFTAKSILVPHTMPQIYEMVTGPESATYLAGIKAQYDNMIEAEARTAAQTESLTKDFGELFGQFVKVSRDEHRKQTMIRVGKDYTSITIFISNTIAEIHDALSGSGREAFLTSVREDYLSKTAGSRRTQTFYSTPATTDAASSFTPK